MSETSDGTTLSTGDKFEQPELRFEKPSLTIHGDLTGVTKGFFGGFSP